LKLNLKKIKDLDVYYEASQAIPITSDSSLIKDIIPVGSTIEHLSSNAIPEGTTITSVSSDGVITLSNDAQVSRDIPDYRDPVLGS